MRRTGPVLLCLALLVSSIGCEGETNQTNSSGASGRLTVAVSIVPQAWLVEQVGGEHVEVVTLVSPGQSPATYQPSDAQISRLMQARAYFRIGVPFENGQWFNAIAQTKSLDVVDTRKGVAMRPMRAHEHHEHERDAHEHDGEDPHIWLSPDLLQVQAETVAAALSRLDPANAAAYEANLAAVKATLDDTDKAIRKKLEPVKGKAFFVFHPSWGYFADRYGLEQIAIEIEGKSPTDHELTELQTAARRHGAKVVFVQPQISGKSAAAVAQAVGGRVEKLDPLAPDVPRNLLHVADVLVDSYR